MNRGELRALVRTVIPNVTVWPDATLNSWINDAIRDYSNDFPLNEQASKLLAAGIRKYQVAFTRHLINILMVEYPVLETPPSYLKRLDRRHPAFDGSKVYDWYRDGKNHDAYVVLGETPTAGQAMALTLRTVHNMPTNDDFNLTLPDNHIEALKLFCLWQAAKSVEMSEGADPDPSSIALSLLGITAVRAERSYRAKIKEYRSTQAEGGYGADWTIGGQERIY
jgi:hypothetical protein